MPQKEALSDFHLHYEEVGTKRIQEIKRISRRRRK